MKDTGNSLKKTTYSWFIRIISFKPSKKTNTFRTLPANRNKGKCFTVFY